MLSTSSVRRLSRAVPAVVTVLSMLWLFVPSALAVFDIGQGFMPNSPSELLNNYDSYVNQRGYCCAEEDYRVKETGICLPNVPDLNTCLTDPELQGSAFTEAGPVNAVQCFEICGAKLKKFYCTDPAAGTCSDTPPAGRIVMGYDTSYDCERECEPSYPLIAKSVACRCVDGTAGTEVVCDVSIGEDGIEATTSGTQPSPGETVSPPESFIPRAIAQGSQQAPTGGTTYTAGSELPVVARIDGGLAETMQDSWPASAWFQATDTAGYNTCTPGERCSGDVRCTKAGICPVGVGFLCDADFVCSFTIPTSAPGTLSIEMGRDYLPQPASDSDPLEMVAFAGTAFPQDISTGGGPAPVRGVILSEAECSNQKFGTISCDYDNEDEQRPFVSYTVRTPDIGDPDPTKLARFQFTDDLFRFDMDPEENHDPDECIDRLAFFDLESLKETYGFTVGLGPEGGTKKFIDDGSDPLLPCGIAGTEQTCCDIRGGEIDCTIYHTGPLTTYELSIENIPIRNTPECVGKVVRNRAYPVVEAGTYGPTNITRDLEIPECRVSDCDLCETRYEDEDSCIEDSHCMWEDSGFCTGKVDYCQWYYGCCYQPLTNYGTSTDPVYEVGPRKFIYGIIRTDGGAPEGDFTEAISCFGYGTGLEKSITWVTDSKTIPDAFMIGKNQVQCEGGPTKNPEPAAPRPHIYCDTQNAVSQVGADPPKDYVNQDLTKGIVLFRVPSGWENRPLASLEKYYHSGNPDPRYEPPFEQLSTDTRDAAIACAKEKQVGACPGLNALGQLNCEYRLISQCNAANVYTAEGTPSGLADCQALLGANIVSVDQFNQAVEERLGGVATGVAGIVNNFVNMAVEWLPNFLIGG